MMSNKTVVKQRNLEAFKIWFGHLGYEVKPFGNKGFIASTNSNIFKKNHRYVRVDDNLGGNPAAFVLGEEFENHLVGPLDVNLGVVA